MSYQWQPETTEERTAELTRVAAALWGCDTRDVFQTAERIVPPVRDPVREAVRDVYRNGLAEGRAFGRPSGAEEWVDKQVALIRELIAKEAK